MIDAAQINERHRGSHYCNGPNGNVRYASVAGAEDCDVIWMERALNDEADHADKMAQALADIEPKDERQAEHKASALADHAMRRKIAAHIPDRAPTPDEGPPPL